VEGEGARMNPAPGFKKYPDHKITTQPARVRIQVKYKGELIADTTSALEMHETSTTGKVVAPVVYYLPRRDVRMERLARSDHQTHCPFKGDASYYSFTNGPQNAVWSYEQPYDELAVIKELLAFYPDKFEISAA
jgi:uncharacterized protein (DUF427 family)